MRHAPFALGPVERDRWLVHMHAAIDAMNPPATVLEALLDDFAMTAEAMRNSDRAR